MKILLIGEGCLDVFLYCEVTRLAPDVPVPVVRVVERTENPGMARNVHRNLEALGVHCDFLTNENWREITKTRYVDKESNHTFLRVDEDKPIMPVAVAVHGYDLVAISDY